MCLQEMVQVGLFAPLLRTRWRFSMRSNIDMLTTADRQIRVRTSAKGWYIDALLILIDGLPLHSGGAAPKHLEMLRQSQTK